MRLPKREQLATRLGFLLLSAGCAIGLGNIWRFPYVSGKYGGAIFLGAYIFFLLAVGLPVLIMEFSVGRASGKNIGRAIRKLEPRGTSWHRMGWIGYVGPLILMMFYVPVASWLIAYCFHTLNGTLLNFNPIQVETFFTKMLSEPLPMYLWSLGVIAVSFGVCAMGVRKGVERVVKWLMLGLLALLVILAIHSLTLSGASAGLEFYLAPDWERAKSAGIWNLINDAMNQAFFTLSVGVGSMLIFGSYLKKEHTLPGEALYIVGLDTFVAVMAGLIIFPACFTFGVEPNAGPPLIFITLPNVFNEMTAGYFWGALFFIFMGCAALTTVIAVFEAIISYCTDTWAWKRKQAITFNALLLLVLILPCILGFSVWSGFEPFGPGTNILDLEDFIISNNLLPLGSLVMLIFCTHRYGWGYEKFIKEANIGTGIKFPKSTLLRYYLTYILPVAIILILLQGYYSKFVPNN